MYILLNKTKSNSEYVIGVLTIGLTILTKYEWSVLTTQIQVYHIPRIVRLGIRIIDIF